MLAAVEHDADYAVGEGRSLENWVNPDDVEAPEGLPAMMLWRVMVMPVQPKKVSKGGILLPEQSRDAESHLQFVGKLVAMGPLAGTSGKFVRPGLWNWLRFVLGGATEYGLKVGDWVIYGRYSGQRVEYKGTRLILMNDDEIIARATSVDGFKVYV